MKSVIKRLTNFYLLENGSINKIKTLLDKNGITYDTTTIGTLRTLVTLRSTSLPTHNGGAKLVDSLRKLDIAFPIDDAHDAANKILKAFESCLSKMEEWLQ